MKEKHTMPKRPRTHEIEEKSRRRLRDRFGDLGWVVWDLYPDYGGVSSLIKLVELNSNLRIKYNLDEELLTVEKGNGFVDMAIFGELAELVENASKSVEKGPEDFFYQVLMNATYFWDKHMHFDIGKDGRITITTRYFDNEYDSLPSFSTERKIVDEYDSLQDFKTHGVSKYFKKQK
jgi:hypothetical protein